MAVHCVSSTQDLFCTTVLMSPSPYRPNLANKLSVATIFNPRSEVCTFEQIVSITHLLTYCSVNSLIYFPFMHPL